MPFYTEKIKIKIEKIKIKVEGLIEILQTLSNYKTQDEQSHRYKTIGNDRGERKDWSTLYG